MPNKGAVQEHHLPRTGAIARINIFGSDNGYGNEEKKKLEEEKYLCSSCQPFTSGNKFFPLSTFKFFQTLPGVFLTPQRGDTGKGRATQQVTQRGALGQLSGGGHLSPLGFHTQGQMGQSGHRGS